MGGSLIATGDPTSRRRRASWKASTISIESLPNKTSWSWRRCFRKLKELPYSWRDAWGVCRKGGLLDRGGGGGGGANGGTT